MRRWYQILTPVSLFSIGVTLSASPVCASDLLTNPGFELDPSGPTNAIIGWNSFSASSGNVLSETSASIAQNGTNYFKVYQAFNGALNYNGIYQDNLSGPGAVYSADGWAYTSASDALAGQNVAWIEVTFRDATTNILALYRSALITTNAIGTGAFPKSTWIDLSVTNQYDPNTYTITNQTTTLVAPGGTSFVRYQIMFQGDAAYSAGSVYFDDLTLAQTGGGPQGNWNIVWSDEFNGTSIDTNTWTFDLGNNGGWGNGEMEYYTSSSQNAYVSNGFLHIVALQQSIGGYNYTSARMKTEGLYSAEYGRFEWRASLPSGLAFWPALWMLGTNITSVGWPECGEIDVMENRGSVLSQVQGSLHPGTNQVYTLPGGSVTNFHTYLLEWTAGAISWYVDGVRYETQTNLSNASQYPFPYNNPFFIIMNIAIGGNYLGDPSTNTINAGTTFPGQMLVDYVRLYNLTDPLQISARRAYGKVYLEWPTEIICHLESTTNVLGASSAWATVNGATSPFGVNATSTSVFYRLVSP
jgi:beta-glucanase (GH16 family)